MTRLHTTAATLSALIILGVVAIACILLGNWQLDRAAQREAIAQTIDTGRQSAPLSLTAQTDTDQLLDWRSATVSGNWLNTLTVLVTNRNFNGQPGFWVATPLLIQAETNTAVLVLRGWLPRPVRPGEPFPSIPVQPDLQPIQGQLISRVPRLFELWTFGGPSASALPATLPQAGQPLPQVQNLDLADYARATGLTLLPTVLEQTSVAPVQPGETPLGLDWPLPPVDADKNKGYALQWFSFAAIAAGAWLVIAWRALRRRAKRPPQNGAPLA